MDDDIIPWQKNYENGRFNVYPHDNIVSYVLRSFAAKGSLDRKEFTVLDLGIGGGNNFKFLVEEGFDAYGIDGSQKSISIVIERLGNALAPKLEIGNFVDLPYDNRMFDLVIDRQSIGHNREEKLHQILNEVHRVLKFDGYLYSNVFGQRTSDLAYASRVKNNEYSEFSKGAFSNSHMLVACTPELISTYFEAFDKVDISRSLVEKYSENSVVEEFFISAQKCEK